MRYECILVLRRIEGPGVSFASKQEEYRWFIEALRHKVDIENLIGALELIPDMIREVVRDELTGVKAGLSKLSGEVRDIRSHLERVADSTGCLRENTLIWIVRS